MKLSIIFLLITVMNTGIIGAMEGVLTLKVKLIKGIEKVECEANDTISNIKAKICDKEGIPVNQQVLRRSEGWAMGFPPRHITIELEDHLTVSHYGLTSDETINFSCKLPKNQTEIAAELKARKEAISEILPQGQLPQELLPLIFGYDTYN